MKDNELVPINIPEATENVAVIKPRNKAIKRLFIAVLSFLLISLIAVNFSNIKNLFVSTVPNDNLQLETDTDQSEDTTQNTDTDNVKDDIIPNGYYEIYEKNYVFSSITNNTDLEIGTFDYEMKTANEIYAQYGKEAPVVLITHFSSLEAYSSGKYYSTDDNFYSYNQNVGDIGKALCNTLCESGINAIHMNEVFANGGIYSSKEEFEKSLYEILKIFPSIEYVFDVSRDTIIDENLSMIKPICTINEQKMAQLQIWVGTNETSEIWQKNLSFATMLSSKNQDITKSVILSPFSFSSSLCPLYLKFDVGAYSNTYSEALLLANELGVRISELIS